MKRKALLLVLVLGLTCLPLIAAEVRIEEWDLPTARTFPHDPAVAPDGALWYTGMRANNLGRLDPASGKIREYPLPTPASGPHGLVGDRQGNIWFTANARGYIGRSAAPYAMAATPDGKVWYSETGVEPNTIVRFDPRTGEFATWPIPSGGGVVRHMVATLQGDLYLACSGVNKVGVVRIE